MQINVFLTTGLLTLAALPANAYPPWLNTTALEPHPDATVIESYKNVTLKYNLCGADKHPGEFYEERRLERWWFKNWVDIKAYTRPDCRKINMADRKHHLWKGRCETITPTVWTFKHFNTVSWVPPRKEGYMQDCCVVFWPEENCRGFPVAGWKVEDGAYQCQHFDHPAQSVQIFCPRDP